MRAAAALQEEDPLARSGPSVPTVKRSRSPRSRAGLTTSRQLWPATTRVVHAEDVIGVLAAHEGGHRAGGDDQALEEVERDPGGGGHRRLDGVGVGDGHEGLAPVAVGQPVEGRHHPRLHLHERLAVGEAERARAGPGPSATPAPGQDPEALARPVPEVALEQTLVDPHPQPEPRGDGLGRLHGPLERRGVDGHRRPWPAPRCARPPLSAWARPSSDRCSPGARPGSTVPVVGRPPVTDEKGDGGSRGATGGHAGSSYAVGRAPPVRSPAVRSGTGSTGLTAEIVACRRCPRLVAWREQVARERRAAFADQDYWGRPVPGFGDPGARIGGGRPGPGRPRRQPHRAGSSPATAPGTGSSPPCAGPGWPTSRPASRSTTGSSCRDAYVLGRRALRAAPEQADAGRSATTCLPYPPARAGAARRGPGRGRALGQFAYQVVADELGLRPRPRFGHGVEAPAPDGRVVLLLVPPQPAEHLHREADRAHVRRRLRPGPWAWWTPA